MKYRWLMMTNDDYWTCWKVLKDVERWKYRVGDLGDLGDLSWPAPFIARMALLWPEANWAMDAQIEAQRQGRQANVRHLQSHGETNEKMVKKPMNGLKNQWMDWIIMDSMNGLKMDWSHWGDFQDWKGLESNGLNQTTWKAKILNIKWLSYKWTQHDKRISRKIPYLCNFVKHSLYISLSLLMLPLYLRQVSQCRLKIILR